MTQDIQNFIQYLHQEKNTSENTEVSYARDLKKMNQYLLAQGICDVNEVTATSLTSYVIYLEKEGRKPATDLAKHCVHEGVLSLYGEGAETGSRSVRAFKGAAD